MGRDGELLTVNQICTLLGVSRWTLYRWRELGKAPAAIRLPNGELRIRRSVLENWLVALEENAE